VSPKLSLIYLIAVPILGICLTVIIFKAHPVFERVFKKYDKLNAVVEENVKGVRVVKSFVREDHEIDKFEETSKSIFKDFTKAERIVALNGPLMSFSSYLVIILLAFIGGKMIIGGNTSVTTGDLISMISYANMILMSLMMLSFVLVSITLSRASAKRIGEILNEESDIKNSELALTNVANGEIEFRNVNFSYSKHAEKNCLDDINILTFFSLLSKVTSGIICLPVLISLKCTTALSISILFDIISL
jgi:ATP-binding cassette subfamily B protein